MRTPARAAAVGSPAVPRLRPGLLPVTIRSTKRPTGIDQVVSVRGHR
jgi:hypothetical protein